MKYLPLALCLFVVATAAAAQEKLADCTVSSDGAVEFEGPCSFIAEADGTFSIANADGEGPLYGEISVITVFVVAPGKAEVSGLTRAGIDSRWGSAQRSTSDPACWTGSDFEVCAY